MSELARRLRAARESRGISLDEASHATKIKLRLLEAIDAGDFDGLPDGPPSRGFIKIYARYLGLDPDQSLSDFEAEVGVPITQLNEVIPPPPARQPAVSRYTQTVKVQGVRWKGELPPPGEAELDVLAEQAGAHLPAAQPSSALDVQTQTGQPVAASQEYDRASYRSSFTLKVPKPPRDGSQEDLVFSPKRPSYRLMPSQAVIRAVLIGLAGMAGVIVLVAAVALVILPAVRGLSSQRPAAVPAATVPVTVISLQPTAAVTSGGVAPVETPQVTEGVSATPEAPSASAPVIPPLPGGGVELILDARERAWVRVLVDGNVVYEGIPSIGPNVRWRGENSVGIETGNAGAFEVIINGARLGIAGPRNKTVKLTWDTEGKVTEG